MTRWLAGCGMERNWPAACCPRSSWVRHAAVHGAVDPAVASGVRGRQACRFIQKQKGTLLTRGRMVSGVAPPKASTIRPKMIVMTTCDIPLASAATVPTSISTTSVTSAFLNRSCNGTLPPLAILFLLFSSSSSPFTPSAALALVVSPMLSIYCSGWYVDCGD